jgi:hypothetical protein
MNYSPSSKPLMMMVIIFTPAFIRYTGNLRNENTSKVHFRVD